jgi:hypothetical protein
MQHAARGTCHVAGPNGLIGAQRDSSNQAGSNRIKRDEIACRSFSSPKAEYCRLDETADIPRVGTAFNAACRRAGRIQPWNWTVTRIERPAMRVDHNAAHRVRDACTERNSDIVRTFDWCCAGRKRRGFDSTRGYQAGKLSVRDRLVVAAKCVREDKCVHIQFRRERIDAARAMHGCAELL